MWVQDWIRALVGGFFPQKKMGGSARQRVKWWCLMMIW
jgi:hypothetical protein